MKGSAIMPDARVVARDLEPGDVVQSHRHQRGHVTVILGDCTMLLGGGREVRVINDWFYVPADMEHSIRANARSRMFCVGREDF
jgi:quercetin dioxygenase-like cupin family protein